MKTVAESAIWPHFTTLTDPRQKGKIQHMPEDIIIIAICAVISGADTWLEIYEYGIAEKVWLETLEKLNEITAIPELLNLLEIKGCIVTVDRKLFVNP